MRDMIPNAMAPIIVMVVGPGGFIVLEAGLAFLGLGFKTRFDLGKYAGRFAAVHARPALAASGAGACYFPFLFGIQLHWRWLRDALDRA